MTECSNSANKQWQCTQAALKFPVAPNMKNNDYRVSMLCMVNSKLNKRTYYNKV